MNGRIDHSNYEAWLLDRLEGALTPEQERELDAFLLLHPHLAPIDYELPTVTGLNDALSSLDKAALKRALPPLGLVNDASVDNHLIARLEGDLDPEQLEALRIYLIAHPEWQRAEKIYALTKLVPEAMAYAAKRDLERQLPPRGTPTRHTIGDFLIARLEGDITCEQSAAVDRLVAADAAHQRTWALVQATRIAKDPVVFANKDQLKKKEGRVIAFSFNSGTVRLAAAASVAALIAVGLWFLRSPERDEQRFARVPSTSSGTTAQPVPEKESGVRPDQQAPFAEGVKRDDTSSSYQERPTTFAPVVRTAPSSDPARTPAVPVSSLEEGSLAQTPVVPTQKAPEPMPMPESNPELDAQLAQSTPAPARAAESVTNNERTMGEMLAGTLRERVLDVPAQEARPLDGTDAVAAVDRTLKAVGGERSGLTLERKGNGGIGGFSLRLGRNFAISASR